MAFEFRIFLPLLDEWDDVWLSESSRTAYMSSLESLSSILNSVVMESPRRDNYLVGKHHFGLKYRNEGKLELKVKSCPAPHPFIEVWVKEKYGKKGLAHHKPKILKMLQSLGHSDYAQNDSILCSGSHIIVEKVRNKDFADGIGREICKIKVEQTHGEKTRYQRSHWLSFAVESGDVNRVLQFLDSQTGELKKSLSCCRDIFHSNDKAKGYQFVPVVAGYPLFVQLVAGDFAEAEFCTSVVSPLESFSSFLKIVGTSPSSSSPPPLLPPSLSSPSSKPLLSSKPSSTPSSCCTF